MDIIYKFTVLYMPNVVEVDRLGIYARCIVWSFTVINGFNNLRAS